MLAVVFLPYTIHTTQRVWNGMFLIVLFYVVVLVCECVHIVHGLARALHWMWENERCEKRPLKNTYTRQENGCVVSDFFYLPEMSFACSKPTETSACVFCLLVCVNSCICAKPRIVVYVCVLFLRLQKSESIKKKSSHNRVYYGYI